jgi:hypothetical protein
MNPALLQSSTQPHSGWDTAIGIGIVVLVIACLWLLNRLIMHYFPSTRKPHTTIGNALMRVEATFLPGREHIMEALEQEDEEVDEQGDPPHTGKGKMHPKTRK